MTKTPNQPWYNQRTGALLLALLVLIGAYFAASRALDTGSWQQYGLTFVGLVFGLNRAWRAFRPKKED